MPRPSDPSDNSGFGAMRGPRSPLRAAAAPAQPRNPRGVVDMPGLRRGNEPAPPPSAASRLPEGRRLVVGRDITLAGQISKCDVLIVEGSVEGMRYEGVALDIADGGSYSGNVEVENAEISGAFDGNMTARGRLTIRPSGRVSGHVRYREIEIHAGGKLLGDVQLAEDAPAAAAPQRAPSPAGSFLAQGDDGDPVFPTADRLVGE